MHFSYALSGAVVNAVDASLHVHACWHAPDHMICVMPTGQPHQQGSLCLWLLNIFCGGAGSARDINHAAAAAR